MNFISVPADIEKVVCGGLLLHLPSRKRPIKSSKTGGLQIRILGDHVSYGWVSLLNFIEAGYPGESAFVMDPCQALGPQNNWQGPPHVCLPCMWAVSEVMCVSEVVLSITGCLDVS